MGGGVPIVGADVILWEAGSGAPVKLVETQTGADGSFALTTTGNRDDVGVFYLIAKGGEAIAGAGGGQTRRSC